MLSAEMKLHVVFAGMLDDPYMGYVWLLLPCSVIGSLICFYRYKTGYVIIPIIGIVSALFLRYFLEPENYRRITTLSDAMPRGSLCSIGSVGLRIVAMYFGWRRFRNKRAAPA
jgi:hypothetical protein